MRINLKDLSEKELAEFVNGLGEKPYREQQIISWIYRKYAASFNEMTNLSKELRERLKGAASISNISLIETQRSKDGTEKFLFELVDGEMIESVLIPDGKRLTLCISSQVGCAMSCRFCMTGRLGFRRNLNSSEIVDQVISIMRLISDRDASGVNKRGHNITNIVLMGMGEPLNNFKEVIKALWKITGLMNFSRRRITLSTSGITSEINKLAKECPGINLAVSLNATTDKTRNMLMPVNMKYPLRGLIKSCREFSLQTSGKLTFEYVLLYGINDTENDALRLVRLLKGVKSKVNLIPYNNESLISKNQPETDNVCFLHLKKPPEAAVISFQKILIKRGIRAVIRKSRGSDISAACGQLRARYNARS